MSEKPNSGPSIGEMQFAMGNSSQGGGAHAGEGGATTGVGLTSSIFGGHMHETIGGGGISLGLPGLENMLHVESGDDLFRHDILGGANPVTGFQQSGFENLSTEMTQVQLETTGVGKQTNLPSQINPEVLNLGPSHN